MIQFFMQRIITSDATVAVSRRVRWCAFLLAAMLAPRGDTAPLEISEPFHFARREAPADNRAGSLRIRGALALRSRVGTTPVPREISGLAWSEDDQILYAITDDGQLMHLRPRIDQGQLTGLALLARHWLADAVGASAAHGPSDAEGLAVLDGDDGQAGNSRLLIAFEGRPLLAEHAADGRRLRELALPPPLDDARRYAGTNLGLEALAWHPAHGAILAPEQPLRGAGHVAVTLYASDGTRRRYPVDDATEQNITGLDSLPDGSLLALERRYVRPWLPVVITLSRLRLDGDELRVEPLARFSSAEGWPVDNFEAIAHHRDGRFFIASDDNASRWQRGLFVYLELREPGSGGDQRSSRRGMSSTRLHGRVR
jgi:hypothetical protein